MKGTSAVWMLVMGCRFVVFCLFAEELYFKERDFFVFFLDTNMFRNIYMKKYNAMSSETTV